MSIDNFELELAVAERLIQDLHSELNDLNKEVDHWRNLYWAVRDKLEQIVDKLETLVREN